MYSNYKQMFSFIFEVCKVFAMEINEKFSLPQKRVSVDAFISYGGRIAQGRNHLVQATEMKKRQHRFNFLAERLLKPSVPILGGGINLVHRSNKWLLSQHSVSSVRKTTKVRRIWRFISSYSGQENSFE